MAKNEKVKIYSNTGFWMKLFQFIWFKCLDVWDVMKNGRKFNEYGVTLFVNDQGAGKTMAMTEELERLRATYPNALIVTNYGYVNQHHEFKDWKDFFEIRNGADGVIFAIDEIQNEFNSKAWKEFPEELLSEITQQRKQKVKILATAQVWEDVVIQLRRQTLYVAECRTIAERWTRVRCYRKRDYEKVIGLMAARGEKFFPVYKRSFIQDDYLRSLYDTEKKIERLSRTRFQTKKERGIVG